MGYFEKYVEPHSEFLRNYANEIKIYSSSEHFLLSEAYSRYVGEHCLWDIADVALVQERFKSRYDITLRSGVSIPVEVKCRGCSSNSYPTTDISVAKGDFILDRSGWLLVFYNDDMRYDVFDLSTDCFTISTWRHRKTTVEDGEEIVETKYCFDPSKAIYKGRLKSLWNG